MTEDTSAPTRRTVLQLLTGATLTSLGIGTATASTKDITERPPNRNSQLGNAAEWVIELPTVSELGTDQAEDDVSTQRVKQATAESQVDALNSLRSMDSVQVLQNFWVTNSILVAVDDDRIDPQSTLESLSFAESVHPNYVYEQPIPVSEDSISTLDHGQATYGLDQVNVPEVWSEFGTRGENASIAVLDTGVDPSHPDIDLADGGWAEFNAQGAQIDTEPRDPDGHGTHTSGTATGSDASGIHIGVAPDADLYHGKVLDNGGTFAQIAAGIQWAVENDTDVINMSLGATGYAADLIGIIRNAFQMGTFVVTSAGNSGAGTSGSPGNYYDSFSVGASDITGAIADFSSGEQIHTDSAWGQAAPADWPDFYPVPDLSAPGVNVLSSVPGGGYSRYNGTSMASPHVAGIAALVVSADSDLTPSQLGSVLTDSAVNPTDGGRDVRYGYGIIDSLRGLTDITYSATISGQVTEPDGSPSVGTEVVTDYGTSDVTNDEGRYSIPVPAGETTVQASRFGGATNAVTVTADGEIEQNLSISSQVDVQVVDGQRPDMAAAELTSTDATFDAFDITVQAANVEEYAASLVDTDTTIAAADISLTVNGTPIQPGESITFDTPQTGQLAITVEVADDVSDGAQFALNHTFSGPGESRSVSTGPTEVLSDPAPPTFTIVSPNFDNTVGADRTLETIPTIRNDGDLTDTQDVILTIELQELSAPIQFSATLAGGEEANVGGPITFGEYSRQVATQVLQTNADRAEGSFTYEAAEHELRALTAPDSVSVGQTIDLEFEVENIGEIQQTEPLEVIISGEEFVEGQTLTSRNISLEPGTTGIVTISIETSGIIPGTYSFAGIAPSAQGEQANTATANVLIEEPTAPTIVGDTRARDPDGDGQYEDVNGDGSFDIGDVQALFANVDSNAVQNNSSLFDFNNSGDVDIGDVQALFQEYQSN